jgi:phosphatidylglycerol lysyltransferase
MAAKRLGLARAIRPHGQEMVGAAAVATFGSGIVNLVSLMTPALPHRAAILHSIFPLEFLAISRVATLVLGFALILSSINVYKRKRRALVIVAALSVASIAFHLFKGIDYEEALCSLVLLVLLWIERRRFTVTSAPPAWRTAFLRLVAGGAVAFAYGTLGFWMLERREFGVSFGWRAAAINSGRALLLEDLPLTPHTRHAGFFLDSLTAMSALAVVYACYQLFRPALYHLRTAPLERARARALAREYGRSALDYFKLWPDKSLFFSTSGRAFLSYAVAGGFAIVLGDPVGPEEDVAALVREFVTFCDNQDWRVAFYQTLPDFLSAYTRLGFKRLKIGDEAVVELARFDLNGSSHKKERAAIRKLENGGVRTRWYEPPLDDRLVDELQSVSDEWLRIPGRRERRFTLGLFDREYVRGTPVATAESAEGTVLAFVNFVESFHQDEATLDLMRRRSHAPNGVMDYLLIQVMLRARELGYARFNLGMVPMAGFGEHENATTEERVVHGFFQQLNFVFSYRGLKAYKAKFATTWEPRFLIYRTVFDLPRVPLALARVSEIRS